MPDRVARRRGLLALYYGNAQTTGSNDNDAGGDPSDLNSSTFDSSAYLKKMFSERTLVNLLEEHNTIITDVKELDRDMTTLVYENYSKFISATETISKMKKKVEAMDANLESLRAGMESITDSAMTINTNLAPARTQIGNLTRTHTLMRKLQFLFELPTRLKRCVEAGREADAVRYYSRASGVLHRYRHMPSFETLYSECVAIVDEVRGRLWVRVESHDEDLQGMMEASSMLLQLGEPPTQIRVQVLAKMQQRLDENFASLETSVRVVVKSAARPHPVRKHGGKAGGSPHSKCSSPSSSPSSPSPSPPPSPSTSSSPPSSSMKSVVTCREQESRVATKEDGAKNPGGAMKDAGKNPFADDDDDDDDAVSEWRTESTGNPFALKKETGNGKSEQAERAAKNPFSSETHGASSSRGNPFANEIGGEDDREGGDDGGDGGDVDSDGDGDDEGANADDQDWFEASDSSTPPHDIFECLARSIPAYFVEDISMFVYMYKDIFCILASATGSEEEGAAVTALDGEGAPAAEAASDTSHTKEDALVEDALRDFVEAFALRLVQFVKATVESHTRVGSTRGLVAVLEVAFLALRKLDLALGGDALAPLAVALINETVDALSEVTTRELLCEVNIVTSRVKAGIARQRNMSALDAVLEQTVSHTVAHVAWAVAKIAHLIDPALQFADHISGFRDQVVRFIVPNAIIGTFIKALLTECKMSSERNAMGVAGTEDAVPEFSLFLCRLVMHVEKHGVGGMWQVAVDIASSHGRAMRTPTQAQVLLMQLKVESEPLKGVAKEAAQQMLDRYVEMRGLALSRSLRASTEATKWLEVEVAPSECRAVMRGATNALLELHDQVGVYFGECDIRRSQGREGHEPGLWHPSAYSSGSHSAVTHTSNNDSFMSNIEKLFSQRVDIFQRGVDFSNHAVVTGIVKIIVKTFFEVVRLCTFDQHGLTQIRLDVEHLQDFVAEHLQDGSVVDSLLKEVVHSATTRCVLRVLEQ